MRPRSIDINREYFPQSCDLRYEFQVGIYSDQISRFISATIVIDLS